MTFGILALGFPVSEDLVGFAAFGGSQSLLTFFLIFPILMHSLGDVWPILALGFPVSEDLVGFAAFGGSQSHFLPYLPYLIAFLR